MKKKIITPDMVGGNHNSPLVGKFVLDDPIDVTVTDTDETATKTVRLPLSLIERGLDVGHANGFSGLVREALEKHLGVPSRSEVEQALQVIERAVRASSHRPAA